MSTPRRHHFMPQLLQRRFTNSDGQLCILDKRRAECGVIRTTTTNAFVKRDLNTIVHKDGSRDASLERWYSELEGEVAPVIEKIVANARARIKPGLTSKERRAWDNFFYHQQKRAPDVYERLGLVDDVPADVQELVAEFERDVRPLNDQERNDLADPLFVDRIVQNASVIARRRGSQEIIQILASRGIAVALIVSPNKSFVLGDYPVARMGPESELDHPKTELWLPIAHDVAVSPWGAPMTEELHGLDGGLVRRANEVIFQRSNIVAARSASLLRSLARL